MGQKVNILPHSYSRGLKIGTGGNSSWMGAAVTPCWDAAVPSGSQFGPVMDWEGVLTSGSICGQPRLAGPHTFLYFKAKKKLRSKP